jgi:hypothetical protein
VAGAGVAVAPDLGQDARLILGDVGLRHRKTDGDPDELAGAPSADAVWAREFPPPFIDDAVVGEGSDLR